MSFASRVLMLLALWLLAWGEASVANVVSGLAVATALLVAFPPRRRAGPRVRIKPIGTIRLVAYVITQLVSSNALMTRQILRPPPRRRSCVLAHPLRHPSEEVITVMSTVIALSPGTMTVDVADDSSTIFVHFFHLQDLDAGRRTLARLEQLVIEAVMPGVETTIKEAG
jgi:multicomponent Na+:H+ antiporter subunit E